MDILRGAALLGVLLVNLLIAFRVPLLQHLVDFHTHPGRLNQIVDLLLGNAYHFSTSRLLGQICSPFGEQKLV